MLVNNFVSSGGVHDKGWFATPAALRAALPVGEDGDYAVVGSTDTVWVWDSDTTDWVDTGSHYNSFIGLADTPSSYASAGLQLPRVNVGETGLEFVSYGLNEAYNAGSEITGASSLASLAKFGDGSVYVGLGVNDFGGGNVPLIYYNNTDGYLVCNGSDVSFTVVADDFTHETQTTFGMLVWGDGGPGVTGINQVKLQANFSASTLSVEWDGDTILLDAGNNVKLSSNVNFFSPDSDGGAALGTDTLRFSNVFLNGELSDGTDSLSVAEAKEAYDKRVNKWNKPLSFASNEASLLYDTNDFGVDGSNQLYIKDGGINHASLTNLSFADSGHTGFEPTVTKGNLTESTSSVLTIGSGTNCVIGTGTTISVTQASSGVSGYLSGTDWNTFNSKENALTFSFPLSRSTDTISLLYDSNDLGVDGSNQLYVKDSGIDHGGLTGLGDDDHTQYLRTDGTRDLSGDWTIGTNSVTLTAGTLTALKGVITGATSQANALIISDGTNQLELWADNANTKTMINSTAARMEFDSSEFYFNNCVGIGGAPESEIGLKVSKSYYSGSFTEGRALGFSIENYTTGTTLYGVKGAVYNGAAGDVGTIWGLYFEGQNDSVNNLGAGSAIQAVYYQSGSGRTDNARGLNIGCVCQNGTITNGYAVDANVENGSSETMTNGYGINSVVQGSGVITNAYGLKTSVSAGAGSTIAYGGYFEATSSNFTTNIGVYSNTSGGTNNCAGRFEGSYVHVGDGGSATNVGDGWLYAEAGVETSGNITDGTYSVSVANIKDAYDKRVDTWGDGLSYITQTASIDYNTTNLKITSNQIDTIQSIATSATPSFVGVDLSTTRTTASAAVRYDQMVSAIAGLDWQDSVLDMIDFTSAEPSTPSEGDRYINTTSGTSSETSQAVTENHIYEWNGVDWTDITPNKGFTCWVEDVDTNYTYNGSAWVEFGSTVSHNNTTGLQGGTSSEYYHLTSTEHGYISGVNAQSLLTTASPSFAELTVDNINLNGHTINTDDSQDLQLNAANDVQVLPTSGQFRIQNGTKTYFLSVGDDKALTIQHDDTNAEIEVTSGNLILNPAGYIDCNTKAISGVTTLSMNNQLTNTLADGTAPFIITSTTQVANLNVARAGLADTITVADTTDASCYIAMFEDATGNMAVKTDGGLTYNASTGVLSGSWNGYWTYTGTHGTIRTYADGKYLEFTADTISNGLRSAGGLTFLVDGNTNAFNVNSSRGFNFYGVTYDFNNGDASGIDDLTANKLMIDSLTLNNDDITSSTGTIGFDNENLETTGTITGGTLTDGAFTTTAGAVTGVTALTVDNLNLNGNTLTATGDLIFSSSSGITRGSNGEYIVLYSADGTKTVTLRQSSTESYISNSVGDLKIKAASDIDADSNNLKGVATLTATTITDGTFSANSGALTSVASISMGGVIDCNNNSIREVKALSFNGEIDDGNSSTADTIDWTTGNFHKSTLTGNCVYTFTAPTGPATLVLKLIQDATGGRTATWPATVKWQGDVTPALSGASATDIITFYYDGTSYYGSAMYNLS